MWFKNVAPAPTTERALDIRLALALGWSWQEVQPDLWLLCPPPTAVCDGFVYDEHGDGYQFVPCWSTDWRAARSSFQCRERVSATSVPVLLEPMTTLTGIGCIGK